MADQTTLSSDEISAVLRGHWRTRLFRRQSERIADIVVRHMGMWKMDLGGPDATSEWQRRYWRSLRRNVMETYRAEIERDEQEVGVFPWLWLVSLVINLLWQWWLNREQQTA